MPSRLHHRVRLALRSFVQRHTSDRELDEELAFHFEQMDAHRSGAGQPVSRDRPARGRFGIDQVREACRDMRTLRPLEDFLKDVRFGARLLVRSPVFSLVAILSLALGIGATTTIFSLINAIVLRTLPVEQPAQLHIVETRDGGGETNLRFSYPLFEAMRNLTAGQAEMAAMSSTQPMQILARGSGERAGGTTSALVQLVSGEYFDLLRQRPQAGRLLTSADNRTLGAHPVAVISDGYWTRTFGRAPSAIGRDIVINGAPFTIVGVTAPAFFGTTVSTRNTEIWAPLMMQAAVRYAGNMSSSNGDGSRPWPTQREVSWLNVLARLPRARVPAVAEAMTLAFHRDGVLMSGYQDDAEMRRRLQATRASLVSGSGGFSSMRENLMTPLLALLAMVGLLLAIACANLASLLLARASSRHREMAVRLSMGAGRWRLVRQLLTESLLLALVGGVLGLAIAHWGSTAFLRLGNDGNTAVTGIDVTPDWRVAAFTLGMTVLTGLLFGLLPALRGTGVSLSETLKSQTRGAIGPAGGRQRMLASKLLIATQMSFSLLLLIVAALFGRSLQALTRVDIGFDRDHLLMVRIDPHSAGYAEAELSALARRVRERLSAVPGVAGVSLSSNGLFGGSRTSGGFSVEGYARGRDERLVTRQEGVSEGYFDAVRLRLLRGRAFGPQDFVEGRRASIINETMARRYFGTLDVVGKRWSFGDDFDAAGAFEIVGVAADARYDDLRTESLNMVYLPAMQGPWRSLEIRAAGGPERLAADVRTVLRQAEPRLLVQSIETLDSRVDRTLRPERLLTGMVTAFSSVALFLACLGLYGTISYAVARRTAELGVRMALGASRGAVLWMIMREALALVAAGLIVGVPLAYVTGRAMTSLFYAVPPSDPIAHAAAAGVLVAIAALAAYLPARRASRIDPMMALRAE